LQRAPQKWLGHADARQVCGLAGQLSRSCGSETRIIEVTGYGKSKTRRATAWPSHYEESFPNLLSSSKLHTKTISAAGNGWDNRNLSSSGYSTHKPTSESNVLVPDENIDVLANVALFRRNPMSKAGKKDP
jgi:hypothetical protein